MLTAEAGIAGPALAHWLGRQGMQAHLVERSAAPREGRQTVDLRGAGRDVARRMGLERALQTHTTREEGIRFVDAANRTKAAFTSGAFGGQGPIANLDILRPYVTRAQNPPPGVPRTASPCTGRHPRPRHRPAHRLPGPHRQDERAGTPVSPPS
ncbi:hypothetical protein [Streptomyces sp. NPDC093089]|uniref:hypothetical protein n=1 Tax=Streptomyces sp. NPDC093089 TaxID=3366024 RepID=UPI00381E9EF0